MVNDTTKGRESLGGILVSIFLVAVALIFIAVLNVTYAESSSVKTGASSLMTGWYMEKNGEKTSVDSAQTIRCDSSEEIVLYNDSLTAEDTGKLISTRGAQYGLKIMLDDEVLYEYKDAYFPRNNQMKSKQDCDAKIPDDFSGGTLKFVYQTPIRGKIQFSDVWIGSESEIFIQHMKDTGLTFGVAFTFAILSVIALGFAIYLHFHELDSRYFIDVALFLLICSIWFVTDSSLVQQYSGNPSAVCVVSFYAFMLLAIPMICFVKNTGELSRYRTFDALIYAFIANAAVQGILNLFFGIEFIDMLFVTHLLLISGVAIITVLTVRECRGRPSRDVRGIAVAFCTVAASGVLALLLYWLFEVPYYGSIFELGVLVFVVLILSNVIISMAQNIHYRTELKLYQRMMREDWMTGLWNRQPFEELLSKIQKKEVAYDNAALVFLDLNGLKQVNDEFGHAAGDELILGAARCIQAAFGEAGSCYRLGGDEFGAILLNVRGTPEEWFEKLDREIEKYNRHSRHRMSIARGWSDLRKADGTDKTISDWKYEADRKMYEDKGKEIRL